MWNHKAPARSQAVRVAAAESHYVPPLAFPFSFLPAPCSIGDYDRIPHVSTARTPRQSPKKQRSTQAGGSAIGYATHVREAGEQPYTRDTRNTGRWVTPSKS